MWASSSRSSNGSATSTASTPAGSSPRGCRQERSWPARLACERADVVSAIAPVAGTLGSAFPCAPSRPVSVLQVHGTADPVVPFGGGPMVGRGGASDIVAAPAMAQRWRDLDGCPAHPSRTSWRAGAPIHRRRVRWRYRGRVRASRRWRSHVARRAVLVVGRVGWFDHSSFRRLGSQRAVLRRTRQVSSWSRVLSAPKSDC